MNVNLHRITYIFFLSVLFISLPNTTKAQELKDELKKQLKQSLLNSDMKHSEQMYQPNKINFQNDQEVLKVSPTTKLPTRLDRFRIINNLKDNEIKINLKVTNALPINVRPRGSVKYEFDGGKMNIRSNAGEVVKPSGIDLDPARAFQSAKARKRKEKVDKIVKAYALD